MPTLFVGGEHTPGSVSIVLKALAAHVPGARVAIIPNTTHLMFAQDPLQAASAVAYCGGRA